MENMEMPVRDHRIMNAWESYATFERESWPEGSSAVDRHAGFIAGWKERERASLGNSDFDVVIANHGKLLELYKELMREVQQLHHRNGLLNKFYRDAQDSLKSKRITAEEIIPWKRVSSQRKEIKRLHKRVNELTGYIIESGLEMP